MEMDLKELGEMFEEFLDDLLEATCEVLEELLEEEKIEKTISNPTNAIKSIPKMLEPTELKRGDHIYVHRLGYTHHGIYTGDDVVVHYRSSGVTYTTLEDFADGMPILVDQTQSKYSTDEVIERAYSRLRESQYNLLVNNCEHFAIWCRNGD